MKHCSEALSIYKTFVVMIHTCFALLFVFHVDSTGEYLFYALRHNLSKHNTPAHFHALVLMLRMVLLSASIIIYLKLLILSCLHLLFLLIFRPMLLVLEST
jgi:hypothetical protein